MKTNPTDDVEQTEAWMAEALEEFERLHPEAHPFDSGEFVVAYVRAKRKKVNDADL